MWPSRSLTMSEISWKQNLPLLSYLLLSGKSIRSSVCLGKRFAPAKTESFVSFTLISFAYNVRLCLLILTFQFFSLPACFCSPRCHSKDRVQSIPTHHRQCDQCRHRKVRCTQWQPLYLRHVCSFFVLFFFAFFNCYLIQVVSKSVFVNAFQVLRARQVEQQIRATLLEQESFEASITSRWGNKGAVVIIIITTKFILIFEWHWSLVFTNHPSIAKYQSIASYSARFVFRFSFRFSILRDLFESLPMELKTVPPDERPLSGSLNTSPLENSWVILVCPVVAGEDGGIFVQKFGQANGGRLCLTISLLPSNFG